MTAISDPTPYFAKVTDTPLADAFDDGRQAHSTNGQVPVANDEQEAAWQDCLNTGRTAPGMAYVHIPFCENHCLFCGFYQNPWRVDAGASYVDLVLKQAATFEGKKVMEGPPLRALYFGGGTPTALAAKDIGRLVSGLRTLLPLAPDCEITLEGRVHSFTEDKMEAAFKAGVNRVSLGVQTFDTRIRRSLGRKRTKDDVIRTLQTLMAMDSAAIVIDMMYGLPGQTLKSWQDDLTIVDQLGLDGVDHYGLNLIPGTPLMLSIEKGKLEPVTRKQLGTYYAHGTEVMQTMGWEQISPSHWRNLGLRERSVYNFGAKTGWDFFAFGSGAGGKLNGCSFFNNPSLAAYGKLVEAGKNPVIGMSRPTAFTPVMNAIRAGMERSRIDPSAIRTAQLESRMKGQDVLELLQPLLEQYQESGLMVSRHRFFDLTLPGRFWNVQMTQRIVAWLSGHFFRQTRAATQDTSLPDTHIQTTRMQGKQNMSEEISARVAAALAEKPTSALEDIAKRANVRVIDVVRNLPDGEAHCVDGEHFVDVMQSMRNWGDITFIVNTGTVIFEAKGQIPDGSLGHGYYNLHGKPIGGHLKADACELIAFVSRTFMNSETHSVQFYAKDGTCMFKVYLGRDEGRNILPGQVDAFKTLRDRITG